MSSIKITQVSRVSEDMELTDEVLEVVAGGSNSADISQSAVALNDGIGVALSSNSSEISQIEKKTHFFGSSQ